MKGREDWKRYYNNSVIVPTCDTDIIREAAREANAYVSMGITERDPIKISEIKIRGLIVCVLIILVVVLIMFVIYKIWFPEVKSIADI